MKIIKVAVGSYTGSSFFKLLPIQRDNYIGIVGRYKPTAVQSGGKEPGEFVICDTTVCIVAFGTVVRCNHGTIGWKNRR